MKKKKQMKNKIEKGGKREKGINKTTELGSLSLPAPTYLQKSIIPHLNHLRHGPSLTRRRLLLLGRRLRMILVPRAFDDTPDWPVDIHRKSFEGSTEELGSVLTKEIHREREKREGRGWGLGGQSKKTKPLPPPHQKRKPKKKRRKKRREKEKKKKKKRLTSDPPSTSPPKS